MNKTLSLLLVTIGHVRADPLTEDMTKLNAQWDAAINDPNFDALMPMYAADASLMPPDTAPVSGSDCDTGLLCEKRHERQKSQA
jgi:hypothetical protein